MDNNQHQLINYVMTTDVIDCGLLDESSNLIISSLLSGLNVARAGIWLYSDTEREHLDAFLVVDHHHNSRDTSTVLARADFPIYFDALDEETVIVANDTFNDPITREFITGYLDVLNITSMLDAPIRISGKTVGVVCCENIGPAKSWSSNEILFATLLADQFGRALAAKEKISQYQLLENTSKELNNQTAKLKALHNSLDRFSLIANLDVDGTITDINSNYLQVTRYQKNELVGRHFNALAGACSKTALLYKMWETLKQDQIWQGILILKSKTQESIWVDSTITPVKNHMNKTVGYIGLFHDKTHEIDMESQLYESEKMALMGSFSYHLTTQEWRGSQNLNNIFQCEMNTPITWSSLANFLSYSNVQTLRQQFKQLVKEPVGTRANCTLKQEAQWYHFIFQRHEHLIIGSCQDITKQHLQQLTLDNIILLQNTILDSANLTIIATTPNGLITHFNKTAETLLQFPADEVIHKETPCLFLLSHEIHQHSEELLTNDFFTLVEGADLDGAKEVEYHYLAKDGQSFPVSLSISAIRNEAQDLLGYLFVGRDLREQKAAEQYSEQMRSIMETAGDMAAFSGFAYDVKKDLLHLTHEGFRHLITKKSGHHTMLLADAIPFFHLSEKDKVLNKIESAIVERKNFDFTVQMASPNRFNIERLRIVGRVRIEKECVTTITGFVQDVTTQSQLQAKLLRQAYTDELTQLPNRRQLINQLEKTWQYHLLHLTCPAVIIMDIDHFKFINDKWGHDAGDQALRHLAKKVEATLDEKDVFGRFGGEEFMIILNDVSESKAYQIAESVRQKVESSEVFYKAPCQPQGAILKLTVSMGLCSLEDLHMETSSQWLISADEALYTAKSRGRNNVSIYHENNEPVKTRTVTG